MSKECKQRVQGAEEGERRTEIEQCWENIDMNAMLRLNDVHGQWMPPEY